MSASPRLVIFDCDGVLVDSEPLSVSVLVDIITGAGGVMTEALAYRSFLGRSMGSVGTILTQEHGFTFTDAHLGAMRKRLHERLRLELKPIPGIADALAKLPCPACVASSSGVERIRLSLETTGLLHVFDGAIYSASMVKTGKPAPDLFLHAAQAMGAAPGDCVVIEDSPAGVEAAKRAGMRVLAFTGGTHSEPAGLLPALTALQPDLIFSDMRTLPEHLAALDDSRGQARAS